MDEPDPAFEPGPDRVRQPAVRCGDHQGDPDCNAIIAADGICTTCRNQQRAAARKARRTRRSTR